MTNRTQPKMNLSSVKVEKNQKSGAVELYSLRCLPRNCVRQWVRAFPEVAQFDRIVEQPTVQRAR